MQQNFSERQCHSAGRQLNHSADITAKEFVFGGATVNVGGNKLTADTVTISSGNNYFANGSLIANGNMNINSDFNFGYGSAGGKLYANILSVAEGKTLTISGTGTTEIYERLDMNPTSNLNITNGTHNINVMKFISGASATKNAVKITGANVYLNKGKQASTTPYYNGVINASYSTGKSQVEITLREAFWIWAAASLNTTKAQMIARNWFSGCKTEVP